MAAPGAPTVMVVDDDPQVRVLYADYLADDFAVVTAPGGREALERLDGTVDVVLLDRRMPDLSGDEVLERIRDRQADCAVAVVTAVEPDLDVIDMGFDDYVVKPVTRAKLTGLVERLLRWVEYDACIRGYFALASKVALLEAELPAAERRQEPEYQALRGRLEAAEVQAQRALDEAVAVETFESVCHRTVAAD